MAENTPLPVDLDSNLVDLVRQVQDSSDAAVRETAAKALYDRYREPLLAVIRPVIFPPLRRLYDSWDFLLETFTAIFTKHFNDEVLGLPKPCGGT
jgi:hypothetical protein